MLLLKLPLAHFNVITSKFILWNPNYQTKYGCSKVCLLLQVGFDKSRKLLPHYLLLMIYEGKAVMRFCDSG